MRNQVKFNFFTILVILIATINFSFTLPNENISNSKDFPKWMQGEWISYGLQLNTMETWGIYLNVKKKTATIQYPSLECGGNWKIEKQEKNKITLTETITEGKDKCVNKGKVIITKIDADHISFTYFSPFNDRIEAFSTLVSKDLVDIWDY